MSGTAFSSSQLLTQFLQDEGFLLRCAMSFDWDGLMRRCNLIVEIFTTSILDRFETNHKQIKRSAKRQLLQTDNWMNTPLHMACYNRAPPDAIEVLLDADAAAAEDENDGGVALTEQRTWKGDQCTPLCIACAVGASPRIIQLLINHYVPGSSCSSGGKAIRMPDARGKTPLVELCEHYEKMAVTRRYRFTSPRLTDINLRESASYSELFQDFWECANHLLRGAWTLERPPGESMISILHAAAFMADCCPPVFTDLLLRSNPHMVAFPCRRGVLPLHLAVSTATKSQELSELQRQNRSYFIQNLCHLYPAAVSKTCPASGRTPFCEAIASGLSWSSGAATNEGPLPILLQHQPDALYARDLVSHLPPFLLAAAVVPANEETRIVLDEAIQVDTIYNVLRSYPQVLNSLLQ